MRRYINLIAFFSIFLDNLYLPINLGFDFRLNYIFYLAFIFYYLFAYQKIRFSLRLLISAFIVCCLLFLVPLIGEGSVSGFIKQGVLIVLNVLFSVMLLNAYEFDLEQICKDYLSIVNVVCFVVIIQLISLKTGFVYGADFGYYGFDMGNFYYPVQNRMQAWFQEPSFLVYAIMPAVFMALSALFGIPSMLSKKRAIFVLITLMLTWSSIGFLGLLFALAIILFSKYPVLKRPLYLISLISIVPIIALVSYQVPEVKKRINDSVELFFNDNPTKSDIDNTNLSTYALYSNYRVTKETFVHNTIFGTGLGTYEEDYDKYINDVIPESEIRERYALNKKDANSLLLRLLAETGFVGLFFFGLYLYNKRIEYSTIVVENGFLWAFNNGILVLIILRLLRQGHYTSLGFILFLMLYYFAKKGMMTYERAHKAI